MTVARVVRLPLAVVAVVLLFLLLLLPLVAAAALFRLPDVVGAEGVLVLHLLLLAAMENCFFGKAFQSEIAT